MPHALRTGLLGAIALAAGLIAGALMPRELAAMEPGLVALVDRLLASMAERGREADLIAD